MSALDPASRELLQAIGAYLDVTPKPTRTAEVVDWWKQTADRAAVVRVAIDTLLAHATHQERQALRLAEQLRRLTAEGVTHRLAVTGDEVTVEPPEEPDQ